MEVVIFGTATLIGIAVFVALAVLPFYLLHLIGSRLGNRIGFPAVRWLLPIGAIGLVSSWGYASYSAFEKACQTVPGITMLSSPSTEHAGFTVRNAQKADFGGLAFNWPATLETGVFEFVDVDGRRQCRGRKAHEASPTFPLTTECNPSLRTGLVVDVLPLRASGLWWSPPIFEAVIEVRDMDSGRLLAKATDLLFGGGITGRYLRLLLGDQDFKHLSCGFASADMGPWRPSLTSHPRYQQYHQADLRLIKMATGRQ